jgi:hypothetical protein
VTYSIATVSDTAWNDDFVPTSLGGQSIPAGQLSKSFSVPIVGETIVEPNQWFKVNLSAASGASIYDGQALGVILNDDGPTLSVADLGVSEGDSGTKLATFTVKLSQAAAAPVTFNATTANGTATAGSDYVAQSFPAQSIPAGQLARTISVTLNGDTAVEGNETILLNLGAAANASILDAQGAATIVNDDGPTLSIGDVTLVEGNAGTTNMTFTVLLSQAAAVPVTYSIATANDTASAGSDYVAKALVGQAIPAGQFAGTFTVTVNGDTTLEANEWLKVNLSAATGASIADGEALGIVLNDEGPNLRINDVAISEGASGTKVLTFTVSTPSAAAGPITYNLSTSNTTAAAGSDYVAKALVGETIAAGMLSKTFGVTINGDGTVEPSETFKVTITSASGATIYDQVGVGTITNDD